MRSKIFIAVLIIFIVVLSIIFFVVSRRKEMEKIVKTKGGVNNPGNIRNTSIKWGGEVTKPNEVFESFDTIESGIKAMYNNLKYYADKYNIRTIRGIISRWAPPTDGNATETYIKVVSNKTGIPDSKALSPYDYPAVIAAMSIVEGTYPVTKDKVKQTLNII